MEAVKTLEKVGVAPRVVHAPRGTKLTCKGWGQEAAMRMLMNNLDPEVAGDPENLIVYGGRGKAARNWECFYAIVEALKEIRSHIEVACHGYKYLKPKGVLQVD